MEKKAFRNNRNKLLLLGGIFILIVILTFILNIQSSYNLQSRAEEGPTFCQDQCTGRNRCDFTSSSSVPGDPNYNDPCCGEIEKTGDPLACPWPQRGYCTDAQCATIPEGVNRQRCGGPRHSWCNKCIDNKCPGYVNTPPTQAPTSVQPTRSLNTPVPTAAPTKSVNQTQPPQPTSIIRVPPNEPTHPIITNDFQKSRPESISQQFGFPLLQFPKITLPKININLVKLNQNARKPLNFFEYVFGRIVYYDGLLEYSINQKIRSIVK